MDNNNKQEFIPNSKQEVAQPSLQPTSYSKPTTSLKLPLIVSLTMGIVAILEAIALVIVIINMVNVENYDYSDLEATVEEVPDAYKFDSNDDIVAFSLTCTSHDNARMTFTGNNTYSIYDQSSSQIGSGTYSIIRSSAVTLKDKDGSSKTVYYDGTSIIDGTTFYECQENK